MDQVTEILDLARQVAIPKADCRKAGIYFLFRGGEVVYIGQSNNCQQRVSGHMYQNLIQFDAYTIIGIEGDRPRRQKVEAEWINAVRPVYNVTPQRDRPALFVVAA